MKYCDTQYDARIIARVRRAGTTGATREEIAGAVRCHTRTLYDHLAALVKAGALTMHIQKEPSKNGALRQTCRYMVPDAEPAEPAWTPKPWVHPIRARVLNAA